MFNSYGSGFISNINLTMNWSSPFSREIPPIQRIYKNQDKKLKVFAVQRYTSPVQPSFVQSFTGNTPILTDSF
jgi:hypothetical protein